MGIDLPSNAKYFRFAWNLVVHVYNKSLSIMAGVDSGSSKAGDKKVMILIYFSICIVYYDYVTLYLLAKKIHKSRVQC